MSPPKVVFSPTMLASLKELPDRRECRLVDHAYTLTHAATHETRRHLQCKRDSKYNTHYTHDAYQCNRLHLRVMFVMLDRASYLFMLKMMSIIVPRNVTTLVIPSYKVEGVLIHHIQKHETYLIGRTNNDNHFTLLFPTMLMRNTLYWFFGLPKTSVFSWHSLEMKFIQYYVCKLKFLKNPGSLDVVRHDAKTLASTTALTKSWRISVNLSL